jgi:hypothetical protein
MGCRSIVFTGGKPCHCWSTGKPVHQKAILTSQIGITGGSTRASEPENFRAMNNLARTSREANSFFALATHLLLESANFMSTPYTTQLASAPNPLDTLLVQQLADLIRQEKSLETRYPALNGSSKARTEFSNELNSLYRRADRLQRLIEAMEVVGFSQPSQSEAFAPLIA